MFWALFGRAPLGAVPCRAGHVLSRRFTVWLHVFREPARHDVIRGCELLPSSKLYICVSPRLHSRPRPLSSRQPCASYLSMWLWLFLSLSLFLSARFVVYWCLCPRPHPRSPPLSSLARMLLVLPLIFFPSPISLFLFWLLLPPSFHLMPSLPTFGKHGPKKVSMDRSSQLYCRLPFLPSPPFTGSPSFTPHPSIIFNYFSLPFSPLFYPCSTLSQNLVFSIPFAMEIQCACPLGQVVAESKAWTLVPRPHYRRVY